MTNAILKRFDLSGKTAAVTGGGGDLCGHMVEALGAMGVSRSSWLGLPLPFDLTPAGIPGCLLHQSADVTIALGAPNGTGLVPWSIAIPNNPLLLGSELADALLFTGQRVVPRVLEQSGYEFQHPTLEAALRSLLGR